MTEQFKRNIAFKKRIGDLLIGKVIMEGEKFSYLDIRDEKIIRTNIVGNIIEKFENENTQSGKKYVFFKIDDGSGQISLKIFGDDINKFPNLNQGDTIIVIGLLRVFNNEIYISPEIIKKLDSEYLLVRKLEIENQKLKEKDILGKEQIIAVKDKILGTIKNSEEDGGIEIEKLILILKDLSPEIINQEVQKFVEEGIIFEPYPGKVRYLG
jgi:DNA polymerase III alpha subunit